MSTEPAPAFQLYVKEWRSSRAIMRMTFAERGMYLEMLLEQWEHYSLPDDCDLVATLLGGSMDEWRAAWPTLRRKFADRRSQPRDEGHIEGSRRIVNLKLERIRKLKRRWKSTARKGGLSRAKSATRSEDGTYSPAREPAGKPAENQQQTSSPSSSPSPTPSASPTALLRDRQPPMSMGLRRLKFWRWMAEEFIARLGTHADAFDIEGWVIDQDQRETGVVTIKDWWAYWEPRFSAEVARRRLPMASAEPVRDHEAEARAEADAVLKIVQRSAR